MPAGPEGVLGVEVTLAVPLPAILRAVCLVRAIMLLWKNSGGGREGGTLEGDFGVRIIYSARINWYKAGIQRLHVATGYDSG